MYGILLESVKDAIIRAYGLEIWQRVEEYIELDGNEIIVKNIYSDSLFPRIIDALMIFRNTGSPATYMEFFGHSFVNFFSTYGFEKILRVAGRNFRDFLRSIDQLHDSNRFTFPKMKSPLFILGDEDSGGCYLHYQSKRRGFNSYVVGQLKECARKFYQIEVEVNEFQDLSDEIYNHMVFRIDFDNKAFVTENTDRRSLREETLSLMKEANQIKVSTFLELFPFSFGFDKNLKIKSMGKAFRNLFDENIKFIDMPVDQAFQIIRPNLEFNAEKIILYSNSAIFEFENKLKLKEAEDSDVKLSLKGQMKFIEDVNLIFFFGHPVLRSMEELAKVGVYLNDLNKFDGSSEMLVIESQHNTQLQKAFDAQHAWTEKLENTRTQLNTWKKKSRKLLYSMLPARIAIQIEGGVQPNSICESFNQVTIMFVNTVNFNLVINNSEPSQIITFINSTINIYDKIVSTFDRVHKIETKADGSYMVVAGIDSERKGSLGQLSATISNIQTSTASIKTATDEEFTAVKRQFLDYNQVELISEVALEILENCKELPNPFGNRLSNNESLKIKIGFHTGPVVAGIVGLHNIQFCLFGDTVNTASRMCSNCCGGKALMSQASFKLLEFSKFFETEFRDIIDVKGKGSMKTYSLTKKKNVASNNKLEVP